MLGQPDRLVERVIPLDNAVECDQLRIAQLSSNSLGEALTSGSLSARSGTELSVDNGGER
jgi:hypothetical protein